MPIFKTARDKDSWTFGFNMFFVSGSVRLDFNDFPGLSLSVGLFKYFLGVSMIKHELAPTQ